jgi:molybdopterin synthase catalytic subunit
MLIQLSETPFDPWQTLAEYEQSLIHLTGKYGATSVFSGRMRDFNLGDEVNSMTLDHYPGMTEKQLTAILEEATQQWSLLESLIVHRVGSVRPQDCLVLVATWSSHRGDAFDASRFIMEELKKRAPFWKKECLLSGEQRWVHQNSDGYLKK